MNDELRTIGTATRLETANRHDEGTHWSDWYVGMTFDPGMSHETAPVVLRADAEAIIERLRAALAYAQEKAEARIAARERRRAVEWLHKRADSMNDPNARAILNSAATNLGWANAREVKDHAS